MIEPEKQPGPDVDPEDVDLADHGIGAADIGVARTIAGEPYVPPRPAASPRSEAEIESGAPFIVDAPRLPRRG